MNELQINVRPSAFEGLLNIFKLTHDGKHIGYHVENYNGEKITPEMLKEQLDYSLYGVLSSSLCVPRLVEKMNFHMIEQKGNHFLVFKLAPFLGLPGNNPNELHELEELLIWIKDEAIKNPIENVKLCINRLGKDVKFGVISTDKKLEEQLQKIFEEKISSSPVLTQWVANLKTGFKEVEKQCFDLAGTLNTLCMMTMKEQEELINKRPPVIKKRNAKRFRI